MDWIIYKVFSNPDDSVILWFGVSHHVSPGTELEQDFHFIFVWKRGVQSCISTIQEPKEHEVNGDKEVRYLNYFLFKLYRQTVRWNFEVESTLGKRNLNICMNELFKFCLAQTDFPFLSKTSGHSGLKKKKMLLSFIGSMQGVQDFLMKAY